MDHTDHSCISWKHPASFRGRHWPLDAERSHGGTARADTTIIAPQPGPADQPSAPSSIQHHLMSQQVLRKPDNTSWPL